MIKQRQFSYTDIYCITASEYSLGRSNQEVAKQMLEAGIKLSGSIMSVWPFETFVPHITLVSS